MNFLINFYVNVNPLGNFSFSTFNFNSIIVLLIFFFCCGLFGSTLETKNFLLIFLFIELMNGSVIALFSVISIFTFEPAGFIYSLTLLSVAATESGIGLSLLVNYHYLCGDNNFLSVQNLNFLKG